MSRLDDRKNKKTVISELSTDKEDLSQFVKVTFTIRKGDVKKLERYVKIINEDDNSEERITKSYTVRKALNALYKKDKRFNNM